MPSLSRAQGTVSQQTKHSFISGKWWWPVIIPNNCAISEKGQPQNFQGNHTKATRERETPSKVGTPPGERSQNFSWSCLFSWPRSKPSSYPRVSPQTSDVYQTLSKKMLDAHLVVQSPAGANVFDISFLFILLYEMEFWIVTFFQREAGKNKRFWEHFLYFRHSKGILFGHDLMKYIIPSFFRWGHWSSEGTSLFISEHTSAILWLQNLSA